MIKKIIINCILIVIVFIELYILKTIKNSKEIYKYKCEKVLRKIKKLNSNKEKIFYLQKISNRVFNELILLLFEKMEYDVKKNLKLKKNGLFYFVKGKNNTNYIPLFINQKKEIKESYLKKIQTICFYDYKNKVFFIHTNKQYNETFCFENSELEEIDGEGLLHLLSFNIIKKEECL